MSAPIKITKQTQIKPGPRMDWAILKRSVAMQRYETTRLALHTNRAAITKQYSKGAVINADTKGLKVQHVKLITKQTLVCSAPIHATLLQNKTQLGVLTFEEI